MQEASALFTAGWDVTVICPRGPGTMRRLHERLDGIEILRYPQRPASGLAGYLVEYLPSMAFTTALFLWVRLRGPIDVIHGCNPPDLFWVHGLLGRLWGARYVFDQHDANPELAATKWGNRGPLTKVLGGLTRWLERRSYRTAALVITPNESYRQLALRRGALDSDHVIVVRNAPDVARYRLLAAEVVPQAHRVGYVGVMGSQDGLDILLDAWRIVMDNPDMNDARLELVGDGEARAQLQDQAVKLGISKSVTFHGYLQPADFVPILAACAAGVAPDPPTPFNDVSTMVKVIDYLAIGRGIVTFDLAETRLVAGDAACVVSDPTSRALADRLLDVLRSDTLASSLSNACDERIQTLRLDWRFSAQLLAAHYAQFLDASPAEA